MDTRAYLSLLFDFYGLLLTEKQQDVFKLYYEDDFSLAEIAEEINVTRQAVRDILQRAEKLLLYYEGKLKLVDKFLNQKDKIFAVYRLLKDQGQAGIEQACELLENIMIDEGIQV